jgi:hypothetical protein
MAQESAFSVLSRLSAASLGVFRGRHAVELGVSRNRLTSLIALGVAERVLPDTYRMTAVPSCREQRICAALLWGGPEAAAAGRSAGELYGLEGVSSPLPEIVLPRTSRRRRLTSVPALDAYLTRFSRPGRDGTARLRALLDELDPREPSRSTLEVKTRRLLVAHRLTGFTREFPLAWNGRVHRFDFGFEHARTILETNGRRWHDDALDYERDNEKWSVPGRLGYRLVFATWSKVTRSPGELIEELAAALAA